MEEFKIFYRPVQKFFCPAKKFLAKVLSEIYTQHLLYE